MKVEKRGGFSDKVSCLAGFFGGFLARVKCLWSEGAKLLAHGSESFGKIFDRFAVNFQRVGVNCNSFWSHFQKGSLEKNKKESEKKKAQNRTLKFEKHAKTMKNFFWNFFARALAQTFLRVVKLISFLRFFLCRNSFQSNFLSRRRDSKIVWKYKTQMPSHTL